MKKPLHFVFEGDNRGALYREYTYKGQRTWKGIGGVSCGNSPTAMKEYLDSVKATSGRQVVTQSKIPIDVYVV